MAAGNRNKEGKATDYVIHGSYAMAGPPICGVENYGCSTTQMEEITCKKCLKKIKQGKGQGLPGW
jgi:hypothetical protein